MNKLDMESKDIVKDNLEYIKDRFPEAVTEENGELLGEILVKYNSNDYLISEPEATTFAMDRGSDTAEDISEDVVSITASEYAMLMTRIRQMETILSSQLLEK